MDQENKAFKQKPKEEQKKHKELKAKAVGKEIPHLELKNVAKKKKKLFLIPEAMMILNFIPV